MLEYKMILGIMVNFVSCDKELLFLLLLFCFCFKEEDLYLLATDTK